MHIPHVKFNLVDVECWSLAPLTMFTYLVKVLGRTLVLILTQNKNF